jgi:uncharacterized protein
MTVELRPLGVACNIQCQYCYQNPQRDAGNIPSTYDLVKMMAAIEDEGGPFALFGGEPLLIPIADLEALWSWGLEKYGSNSLQTNGALITDEHLRLFRDYKVHVGISIDGPEELNDARWAGSVQHTRAVTHRVHDIIERLCREGLAPSLIVTLHRHNAARDRLPAMCAWLKRLEALGVRSARLHLLEIDHDEVRHRYGLSAAENLEALSTFADLERELTTLRLDLFREMRKLLQGDDDHVTCIWNGCDPYTTRAVRGVEGSGQRSNCGRTNKDGIDFAKAAVEGFERYLALYHTPQEHGGCRDCRFFLMCKGQCPGTALDGDWRQRTEHCEVWMDLYARLEQEQLAAGSVPLSLSPLRPQVEQLLLNAWASGRNMSIKQALQQLEQQPAQTPRNGSQAQALKAAAQHVDGDRLDFTLPDFTRVAWVSNRARDVWAPRLIRLRDLWPEIEVLSVTAGIRPCALLQLTAEQRAAGSERWMTQGLQALSLADGPDVASPVVFGRPPDVTAFTAAWQQGDHEAMGQLLGQPPCCLEFYRQVWVDQERDDTTWPMAIATARQPVNGTTLDVAGPPQTNIFWRWLGVRAVPHLPCCCDCAATVAVADRFIEAERQAGFHAEADWLLEMLDWPVEWSARHGIAEVRTPILKMATRTDATGRNYIVRRSGSRYPAEGAQGLKFPYRLSRQPLLTLSTNFRRGLEHAAQTAQACGE